VSSGARGLPRFALGPGCSGPGPIGAGAKKKIPGAMAPPGPGPNVTS